MKTIPVTGTVKVEISEKELGHALGYLIANKYEIDDAGCDLYVNEDGYVCLGSGGDGVVSCNGNVRSLVDAMNILIYGYKLDCVKGKGEDNA